MGLSLVCKVLKVQQYKVHKEDLVYKVHLVEEQEENVYELMLVIIPILQIIMTN